MNRTLIGALGATAALAVGAIGFVVLNGLNQSAYRTEETLPEWTTRGVNKTADQLFKSFKITASSRAPQVNDVFPLLELKNTIGQKLMLRGQASVLVIGSDGCSSCQAVVEAVSSKPNIQTIKLIPYGPLPTDSEQGVAIVDVRLEQDKSNREIVPSSGKLASLIGMAQFIGSYVLDKNGLVYYATFQSASVSDLLEAVHRIELGQQPASPVIHQSQLGKKLDKPQDPSQRAALEPLLNAQTGVVIFTAEGCSSCNGLSNDLKATAQKWLNQGVSVAIVDAGRKDNGELMTGVPIIADPNGVLSNSWGRVGLPQAIVLDKGQYAGTTPFAESQFKRQLPGQPEESFATKAPFTRAISSSIDYVREKRVDKNP